MRENPDPKFSASFYLAVDCNTRRLDLPGGQAAGRNGLKAVFAEGNFGTAFVGSLEASPLSLPELNSFR
ncbi:hypothetical protein LEP1GSC047_3563 [Leptospira inadai serovar Lyme str. 10]|uniref:Uncharacterized protein n=1 Tax=Leptospira inadai serovar Lyme str. 10 TaxID=1049790 RepID=V6HKY2_9LEPT|nr:hypothetical protein LEP1GSC047_3563 [Leptospira inadai serovar Lyme str. 10]